MTCSCHGGPTCCKVAAARPIAEASWTWTDSFGKLLNYTPALREMYLGVHEAPVDMAASFGYHGA